jgi:glycosyltransferase involved in cell wall biosynthesis
VVALAAGKLSPSLSVVVIGRNEGERLRRCLASVRAARGLAAPVEIVYVDSASVDGSPETARESGARVIVLDASRSTAARGRNAGWRATDSDLVLFLDGDTILDPDFPERAVAALSSDPTIAAVWGHRRELYPERSVYNRVLDLDWVVRPGFTDHCGGDVLLRRQALVDAGGYDESLIAGEEPDLCRRFRMNGCRILHIDVPMTGHDLAMTRFSQYWRRAVRAGHAYAEVSRRHREGEEPIWRTERRRNFIRCSVWLSSLAVALSTAAYRRSLVPVAIWLSLFLTLSARSAWKARWKSSNWLTLSLYGISSHLQQLPICLGQLRFLWGNWKSGERKLIEYK